MERVEKYGYRNFWAILNAKDFGVPQNRERFFMLSIRNDVCAVDRYGQAIPNTHFHYQFPSPFPLTRLLKDVLEEEVDESYYLSDQSVENFMRTSEDFRKNHDFTEKDHLVGESGKKVPGDIGVSASPVSPEVRRQTSSFDEKGLPVSAVAPSGNVYTLYYVAGHPVYLRAVKAAPAPVKPCEQETFSVVVDGIPFDVAYIADGERPVRRASISEVNRDYQLWALRFRIRKLTPRECFRLMGLHEDEIDRLMQTDPETDQLLISRSQLYKMAGNSIVVDVLYYILRNLIFPDYDASRPSHTDGELSLFDAFD